MAVIKVPPGQQLKDVFEPYALELGLLVYSWNHLQDELARLFSVIVGLPTRTEMALAIWHSTPSDLAQRKMLRAAIEVVFAKNKPAKDDLIWLLDKVDQSLSGKRNNAIHAPVVIRTGFHGATIAPYELALNPRAIALRGKDIVNELIWYRDTAVALRQYCSLLVRSLTKSEPDTWPKRPLLPHLIQQTKAKEKPLAKPRKEPQPPPATSQN